MTGDGTVGSTSAMGVPCESFPTGACALTLAGCRLLLLAEHAVWDPAAKVVMVSDLHLGKEAVFRNSAIPVPDQTDSTLARLTGVLSVTGADRLIILGDLLHARRGRCLQMFEQVAEWRRRHAGLRIDLVRGNHDLAAGDPPANWQISCVPEPQNHSSLCLCHDPESCDGVGMAGHLHPVVRLRGPGRDSLRLPCFLLRRQVLILPAFSRFVDGRVLRMESEDRVFAVTEDRVISIN